VVGVIDLLCFSSSSALHFSNYSFLVHHPVNRDDRQLLAHAMASDVTVAWQPTMYVSSETSVEVILRIFLLGFT
jgi:hypothetical protein